MKQKATYIERAKELIGLLQDKQITEVQYNRAIKALAKDYRQVDYSAAQAVFNQACEKFLTDILG